MRGFEVTDLDLTERAERMGRKRTRVLPMIAAIFLVQQVAFFVIDRQRGENSHDVA